MRVHSLVATVIALASFALAGCASDIDDPVNEQEIQQPSGATSITGPLGEMDSLARSAPSVTYATQVGATNYEATLLRGGVGPATKTRGEQGDLGTAENYTE